MYNNKHSRANMHKTGRIGSYTDIWKHDKIGGKENFAIFAHKIHKI